MSLTNPHKYPWKGERIKTKKGKKERKKEEELCSKPPLHSIVLTSFVLFYTFPSGKQLCLKTISKFHLALVLVMGTDTFLCAILIPLSRYSCIVCSVY